MGKIKYDLSNLPNSRKIKEDLENAILDAAKEQISGREFEIECPKCGKKISVKKGINTCPYCENQIDVKLNFNM